MAKIEGRLQTLEVDDGGGFTTVNGIVDGSLSLDTEEIDTTTHDSGAWRSFIAGRGSVSIDLTLKWDEADAGQADLAAAAVGQIDTYGYRFRMQTGTGFKQYTATAGIVTNWNPSGPNDDAAEVSCTIRLSGTVTDTNQA